MPIILKEPRHSICVYATLWTHGPTKRPIITIKRGPAFHIPRGDSLFIETAVYEGAFDFEYAIMYYYILSRM